MGTSLQSLSFSLTHIPESLSYTKPNSVDINGQRQDVKCWKDVLEVVSKSLFAFFPQQLYALRDTIFFPYSRRVCIIKEPNLISGIEIADDLWIESNFSSLDLARLCKELAERCGVSTDSITISYQFKVDDEKKVEKTRHQDEQKPLSSSNSKSIRDDGQSEDDLVSVNHEATYESNSSNESFDEEGCNYSPEYLQYKLKRLSPTGNPKHCSLEDATTKDMSYYSPIMLDFGGRYWVITSWKDLLTTIVQLIAKLSTGHLKRLRDGLAGFPFTQGHILTDRREQLHTPVQVADNLYLETNRDSNRCVKIAYGIAQFVEEEQPLPSCSIYYDFKKSFLFLEEGYLEEQLKRKDSTTSQRYSLYEKLEKRDKYLSLKREKQTKENARHEQAAHSQNMPLKQLEASFSSSTLKPTFVEPHDHVLQEGTQQAIRHPLSLSFFGEKHTSYSWPELTAIFIKRLQQGNHTKMLSNIRSISIDGCIILAKNPEKVVHPIKIIDEMWLEGEASMENLKGLMKWLAERCRFFTRKITINGKPISNETDLSSRISVEEIIREAANPLVVDGIATSRHIINSEENNSKLTAKPAFLEKKEDGKKRFEEMNSTETKRADILQLKNSDYMHCSLEVGASQALEHTYPILLDFGGNCKIVKTWSEFLTTLVTLIAYRSPEHLNRLREGIAGLPFSTGTVLTNNPKLLHSPARIAEELYIETNRNSSRCVKIGYGIASFVAEIHPLPPIEIYYDYKEGYEYLDEECMEKILQNKNGYSRQYRSHLMLMWQVNRLKDRQKQAEKNKTKKNNKADTGHLQKVQQKPISMDDTSPSLEPTFVERCERVLQEGFPAGVKRGSFITKRKFLGQYEATYGEAMSEKEAEFFWEACARNGFIVGETVFPLSQKVQELMTEIVDKLKADGRHLAYYAPLFEAHQEEFNTNGIESPEILVGALQKLFPMYQYKQNLFQFEREVSTEDEIIHLLHEGPLTLDEMHKRHSGLPSEKIQMYSNMSSRIVKSRDKYVLVDTIEFDKEEVANTIELVKRCVDRNGYVMVDEISLENSESMNLDLEVATLKRAFYLKYLKQDYDMKGNMISPKGEKQSVKGLLREFCEKKPQFTLEEIEQYAQSIQGVTALQGINVAQQVAIQVDAEHFVNPSQIEFEVDAIDDALEAMAVAGSVALTDVRSFIGIPSLSEYPWTLQLLCSYCRLVSKRFSLLMPSITDKVVGLIVYKQADEMDYNAAVAKRAVHDGVSMEIEELGKYLIQKGMLLRRRVTALNGIMREMSKLSGEV